MHLSLGHAQQHSSLQTERRTPAPTSNFLARWGSVRSSRNVCVQSTEAHDALGSGDAGGQLQIGTMCAAICAVRLDCPGDLRMPLGRADTPYAARSDDLPRTAAGGAGKADPVRGIAARASRARRFARPTQFLSHPSPAPRTREAVGRARHRALRGPTRPRWACRQRVQFARRVKSVLGSLSRHGSIHSCESARPSLPGYGGRNGREGGHLRVGAGQGRRPHPYVRLPLRRAHRLRRRLRAALRARRRTSGLSDSLETRPTSVRRAPHWPRPRTSVLYDRALFLRTRTSAPFCSRAHPTAQCLNFTYEGARSSASGSDKLEPISARRLVHTRSSTTQILKVQGQIGHRHSYILVHPTASAAFVCPRRTKPAGERGA
jgi:hypothetical protein